MEWKEWWGEFEDIVCLSPVQNRKLLMADELLAEDYFSEGYTPEEAFNLVRGAYGNLED